MSDPEDHEREHPAGGDDPDATRRDGSDSGTREHGHQHHPLTGPIGRWLTTVVEGGARHARILALMARHDRTAVMGLFVLVNGLISIAIMSMAAVFSGQPFIFPSLGPSAFLFFSTPMAPAASPRNAFGGHLIGVLAGYAALMAFGLTGAGPAIADGVTWARVGAAAMSLALTGGVMVWARMPHPPAGATTLIVSLGIMTTPRSLVVLMVAVVVLSLQAIVINRLEGLDYPLWAPTTE